MKTRANKSVLPRSPFREAAISAFIRIIEPLIELMFEAGVTVQEFNKIVREQAVRAAMKRLREEENSESNSRVAIMTGLPRSEVAKFRKSPNSESNAASGLPAERILAAWNDDAKFSNRRGHPAVLPIFGEPASFEKLVRQYGKGVPVRAMLDELTRMQAVDRLAKQRVRLRREPITKNGLTLTSIAEVGDRCGDLLRTLAYNRKNKSRLFHKTVASLSLDLDTIPVTRLQLNHLATTFVDEAKTAFKHAESQDKSSHPKFDPPNRLGMTVYFFEEIQNAVAHEFVKKPRRNLQRHALSSRREKHIRYEQKPHEKVRNARVQASKQSKVAGEC